MSKPHLGLIREAQFQKPANVTDIRTRDSFANFATHTGIGAGNSSTSGGYLFNPVTRNRLMLEWAYRGSWLVGMAVDCVADDMTRAGAEILSQSEPGELKDFDKYVKRKLIWDGLNEGLKLARLYGGAGALLQIDGQNYDEPLDIDNIGKDQFLGLVPLDRWSLWPHVNTLVSEPGRDFGLPEYYDVVLGPGSTVPYIRVHHSRLIRFEGIHLPYWQKITENYWGMSIVERMYDRLVAFDSATQGAAQLVYKAHLRVYKVDGLRQIIASGQGGNSVQYNALIRSLELIRRFQSSEGLTVADAKDDFQVHQITFAGLSDIIQQFGEQLSGALGVPLVRLFGQAPGGLNATGENDLRIYYDTINQRQEREMRGGVEVLYQIAHRSCFGRPMPDDWQIEFSPLWEMSDEQRAAVTTAVTNSVLDAYREGVITQQTAMKELKQISIKTGIFTNITDEDIEAASNETAPTPAELSEQQQQHESTLANSGQEPSTEGDIPKGNKPNKAGGAGTGVH